MKRIIAVVVSFVLVMITGCGQTGEPGNIKEAVDDNYRNYYEVFVYSYYDSNGDGIGDLKGVEEKLDYIADLGCNGIWLMPVMPSTTYHKYDVTDYCDIDKEYGTLEDMDSLINECHAKDIRLIIDLVMNHTSSKHPWFIAACDYLKGLEADEEIDIAECPYVDYYHFSKEQLNNSWYRVPGSDYYYEAVFWSEMPDLNLSSESVKKEFENIAAFWIDRGIDGFRMDATMHFEEGDTAFNTEVMNDFYEYCVSLKPDFYMVSEVWANRDTIADYYLSDTPSMFDFSMSGAEGEIIKTARGNSNAESFVTKLKETEETYRKVNEDYINAPFITNHDMSRVCNALNSNEDDIKFAGGLLLSMGGSPFIYYGEELGMKSKGKKDENKRLPMQWSDDASGMNGICEGPLDSDRDISQSFDTLDKQIEDETSIYNYYRKALHIRNANPVIARGTIDTIYDVNDGDIALIRRSELSDEIYIAYNTQESSAEIAIQDLNLEVIDTLSVDNSLSVAGNGVISVPGKSITYLKRRQ